MENDPKEQESISLKLYQYLCDNVVGSENMVKCRRLSYKVFDDIQTVKSDNLSTWISSGSKAEGLDLPGSDTDIMICDERFTVYDSKCPDKINNKGFPIMKSDDSQPGFVHIVVPPHLHILNGVAVNTEYGVLLSNREYKRFWYETIKTNEPYYSKKIIHGPCISILNKYYDIACCFRCKPWPHVARHCLSRNKVNNLLTYELTNKIFHHGVLLVPIGSKTTGEDNPLEWRISFSEPEKMLIYSFNHTQLLCYALLKLILKQVINKEHMIRNILCSYFMKTVMLWISEELDISVWKPNKLLHCFWNCVQRLLYWIYHNYIPNYFIPDHNMIDGKTEARYRAKLALFIENLNLMGWKSFTLCESLQDFIKSNILKTVTSSSVDRVKIYLSVILESGILASSGDCTFPLTNILYNSFMSKCINRIRNTDQLLKRSKLLFAFYFAYYNLRLAVPYHTTLYDYCTPSNRTIDNRWKYKHYKRCLSHLLIGTNVDAVSGWIMLAIYFYCTYQYVKATQVVNYASSVFSCDRCRIFKPIYLRDIKIMKQHDKLSFFQRLRTKVIHSVVRLEIQKYCAFFYHKDLTLSPDVHAVIGTPQILTSFIRFLCYYRLKNCKEYQKCQQELIFSLHDGHLGGDKDLHAYSYIYLMKMSQLLGDSETAFVCSRKLQNYIQSITRQYDLR